MQEKINSAIEIIKMTMKEYKNPIIYSGFGKDSIVVIHLCRTMGLNLEIMFHRDPYFPKKYRYANKMIDKWNLICRDYPARLCSVFYMHDTFEVVRHYQIGFGDMALCAMLYTPERYIEGEYLCGLKDIYLQPKIDNYDYRWDAIIQGHRTVEAKPHTGMVPAGLRWTNKQNIGSADNVFPLHDWTNQEVYQYIIENEIPINTDVYDVVDGSLVPKEDKTFNPDCRPACYECMRPDKPMSVLCPKKMVTVNNNWQNLVKTVMPNDFPGFHKEAQNVES
jgi:3'-phosphoadenosine 5'-phosphosulfate sulfotransferase (PAPS reductase)/FAD synthetase